MIYQFSKIEVVGNIHEDSELLEMRLYKLLKDLPTVKAGAIFKEKIKIDGTRVWKRVNRRHSILVEIDSTTKVVRANRQY